MRLRLKIMSGFLVLALLLVVAGAWSTWELRTLGSSFQDILDENYRSIHAASMMAGGLEREDSAVLLLVLGQWEQGRATMAAGDSVFNRYLDIAMRNVTVPGEATCLDSIRSHYAAYRSLWERPIVDTPREGNVDWYSRDAHQAFRRTRASIGALAELNQQSLYETATRLKNRASRAAMPGLIAIVASLLVTVVFSYLVQHYVVYPILRITDAVQSARSGRMPTEVHIETRDELYELSNSVAALCRAAAPDARSR